MFFFKLTFIYVFQFWLIYSTEQKDKGMGTEIEGRTSKILCSVLVCQV